MKAHAKFGIISVAGILGLAGAGVVGATTLSGSGSPSSHHVQLSSEEVTTTTGASSTTSGTTTSGADSHSNEQSPGGLDEPRGVAAWPGDSSASLWWSAPTTTSTSPAITGYQVQQSTDASTWSVVEDEVSSTSLQISGLSNGTKYLFRVAAESASGLGEWSAPVSATPVANAPSVPAPAAPTNVTQELSLDGTTTVIEWRSSWHCDADADDATTGVVTSYVINVSTDGGSTWTQLASGLTGSHFSTPFVTGATYQVAAVGPGGTSSFTTAVVEGDDLWGAGGGDGHTSSGAHSGGEGSGGWSGGSTTTTAPTTTTSGAGTPTTSGARGDGRFPSSGGNSGFGAGTGFSGASSSGSSGGHSAGGFGGGSSGGGYGR